MREPHQIVLADGNVLNLTFPFKAVRYFERLTGGHFFSDTTGSIGVEYICGGIAAGLLHQRKYTLDEVAEMLEAHLDAGGNIPTVLTELLNGLRKWGILLSPTTENDEATAPPRPTKAQTPSE